MTGKINLFVDFKSMKEAMGDKTYVSGFIMLDQITCYMAIEARDEAHAKDIMLDLDGGQLMDDPAIFVEGKELLDS